MAFRGSPTIVAPTLDPRIEHVSIYIRLAVVAAPSSGIMPPDVQPEGVRVRDLSSTGTRCVV